jgi:hypothetical protein
MSKPAPLYPGCFIAVITVGLWLCTPAAAGEKVAWATGAALGRQLTTPVDVFWKDTPLRQAIEGLATARHAAVLIDRRVDPGGKLDLSLRSVPLEEVFAAVAAERGLSAARFGDLIYLGPLGAAERLPLVVGELKTAVRRLPPAVARKYLQQKALAWDDFASPRELLEGLARQNGLAIINPGLMPHDLWAAADLPPLSLADRLTLVAFQFELGIRPSADGSRLELFPLPLPPAAARDEKRADRPGPRPGAAKPQSLPPATLEQLHIDRLTIAEKPLEPVLKQLAERLGFELRIDREAIAAAGIKLDQRVSVEVRGATLDELLSRLLRPTGLQHRRRGKVVEIFPASSPE